MRLNWAVQHVEYSARGVKLQSSDGRIVTADYVILAVPVVRDILLSPPPVVRVRNVSLGNDLPPRIVEVPVNEMIRLLSDILNCFYRVFCNKELSHSAPRCLN